MKDKQIAYILWCTVFVGIAGVHRFYLRRYITAVIWLITGGLFLIGQIIDLFLIPGMVERENRRGG
jgi:TM2 domain-containing membrane protein YozV